jgi:hypothetical protein
MIAENDAGMFRGMDGDRTGALAARDFTVP